MANMPAGATQRIPVMQDLDALLGEHNSSADVWLDAAYRTAQR